MSKTFKRDLTEIPNKISLPVLRNKGNDIFYSLFSVHTIRKNGTQYQLCFIDGTESTINKETYEKCVKPYINIINQ